VAKAAADLNTAVEANASAEQLKVKLTALRSAREKANQELAKAQAALKQVLSLKQECLLVMMGTLE